MSTPPQGSTPQGHPSDHPAEPPAWGRQPPGGWGGAPSARPDRPAEGGRGRDPAPWAGPGQVGPGQVGAGGVGPAADRPRWQPGPDPGLFGGNPGYGADPFGVDPAGYAERGGTRQVRDPGYGGPQHEDPGYPEQRYAEPPPWAAAEPPYRGEGRPAWLPRPTPRSGVPVLAVAAVALGIVAVLGFVAPGFLVTRVFDAPSVQVGVARVLVDDYGIAGVDGVVCGDAVPVRAGSTFDCAAVVAGEPVTVPVRVTSDSGDYEVGRPAS